MYKKGLSQYVWTICVVVVAIASSSLSSQASTLSPLYSFSSLGGVPSTALLKTFSVGTSSPSNGALVGAATWEGSNFAGAVYKYTLDSPGAYSILYNFCSGGSGCPDGTNPGTALVKDSIGNMFGTTFDGGNVDSNCHSSCGIVYEISHTGVYSVIYSFCPTSGCSDGANPAGSIVLDSSGNLYGVTRNGGASDGGTIYKLTKSGSSWSESVVHSFCNCGTTKDGEFPTIGLSIDGSNNLYGVASIGGNGAFGTLFEVSSGGSFSVLHSFGLLSGDGWEPSSVPTMDANGNLFGETSVGGAYGFTGTGGTLWEYSAGGGYSVLYSFCKTTDPTNSDLCTDGQKPGDVNGVVVDSSGNIWGTTNIGGGGPDHYGDGVIWKFGSNYHVRYDFCSQASCADGKLPYGGLIQDNSGAFYGVAQNGGANGKGDIFQFTP